ncbi:DNA polymerase kappa subunit [Zalerion maritima]|uniref:DNA polymerase kappa n=1 Tax=Zalerion maritima TaxID=339359 RepID=A0AAD5RTE0_9PEZI|nr:DNA polymerase kappa subunit [Zalerion maritima]
MTELSEPSEELRPRNEEASATVTDAKQAATTTKVDADTIKAIDAIDGSEGTDTLKYSLLGPSLLKAGQDTVDQSKVSEIIYNASKGSKFFAREEERDRQHTIKIEQIQAKKAQLEKLDLTRDRRNADALLAQFELGRNLTQSIVHVDCDAFYASVEQLDRPELANLPFAVGGGVLTTCNYVARKFGVRSGMAGFVAKKLCPQLILIKNNFDKYNAKAREIREILAEYDPRFESASIDEAYLNITEYCEKHGMSRADAVNKMRKEVHETTQITVSAGIAANSKLAKICSNRNKPNGQFELANDRDAIMEFMKDLPARQVNGIGRVFERELAAAGVKTCGDIYEHRKYLRQLFGEKAYEFLIGIYLGLGRTYIQPAEGYERKSVGTERTFRDMNDPAQLREQLRKTAEDLEADMKKVEVKGRTLCIKLKMHTFEVLTRQVSTPRAVCLADDLYKYSLPMLAKLEQDFPGIRIRLMGLRCTHLVSTKKVDTMAFFGLKKQQESSDGAGQYPSDAMTDRKRKAELDGQWEVWPEEEFLNHEPSPDIEARPPTADPVDDEETRAHGKEIVPNPKKEATPGEGEWFDCPICGRPQSTDERQLNEHIDLCLSRRAIRDTLQEAQEQQPPPLARGLTPETKRLKTGNEKRRGRPSGTSDPKQRKLFFGTS